MRQKLVRWRWFCSKRSIRETRSKSRRFYETKTRNWSRYGEFQLGAIKYDFEPFLGYDQAGSGANGASVGRGDSVAPPSRSRPRGGECSMAENVASVPFRPARRFISRRARKVTFVQLFAKRNSANQMPFFDACHFWEIAI